VAYYVEPEYWVEGYAVGDAKLVAASSSEASSVVSAAGIDRYTSFTPSAVGAMGVSPSRRLASVGFLSTAYYAENGYWVDGYADRDPTSTKASPTVQLSSFGANAIGGGDLNVAAAISIYRGVKVDALGALSASSRLKWEDETEPSDIWVDRNEPLNSWTPVTSVSGSWSDVP